MSDIVASLRSVADAAKRDDGADIPLGELCRNAASEIETLYEILADKRRLTRELDVALNGERGAAQQASLCDIVSQVKDGRWRLVRE